MLWRQARRCAALTDKGRLLSMLCRYRNDPSERRQICRLSYLLMQAFRCRASSYSKRCRWVLRSLNTVLKGTVKIIRKTSRCEPKILDPLTYLRWGSGASCASLPVMVMRCYAASPIELQAIQTPH